jgi:hypothetical protein
VALHKFSATISPGQSHHWWTAPYSKNLVPQIDAHPVPTFPEGVPYTGFGARLWYGDFACRLDGTDWFGNDTYMYFVTVRNDGTETCIYEMRVWVP